MRLSELNKREMEGEKKIKGPCCVCKDTKRLRDECIFMKSEELCLPQIEKHKECLRSFGFFT